MEGRGGRAPSMNQEKNRILLFKLLSSVLSALTLFLSLRSHTAVFNFSVGDFASLQCCLGSVPFPGCCVHNTTQKGQEHLFFGSHSVCLPKAKGSTLVEEKGRRKPSAVCFQVGANSRVLIVFSLEGGPHPGLSRQSLVACKMSPNSHHLAQMIRSFHSL